MSAEVANKRGRPKKVIAETIGVNVPEIMKKTTRAKSTRATAASPAAPASPAKPKISKAAKAKAPTTITTTTAPGLKKPGKYSVATPLKSPSPIALEEEQKVVAKKASPKVKVSKAAVKSSNITAAAAASIATKADTTTTKADASLPVKATAKTPIKPIPQTTPASSQGVSKTVAQPSKSPSLPASASIPIRLPGSSPILNKVRELSQKNTPQPPSTLTANPTHSPTAKSVPTNPTPQTIRPMPTEASKPTPAKPIPTLKVPIADINKEIVSNIAVRAGARPGGSNNLPPNYKSTARKVSMAIIAMPIALVTSYVLFQRLVLKEEKKSLFPPLEPAPKAVQIEEDKVVLSTPSKNEPEPS